MHVGEAAVDAVVVEGQFLVVEAKQVKRGGVQVVAVGRIEGGLESEVVGRAVGWADLDGAVLIKNDCFDGATIVDGKITLPDRPGIGAVRRA